MADVVSQVSGITSGVVVPGEVGILPPSPEETPTKPAALTCPYMLLYQGSATGFEIYFFTHQPIWLIHF